MGLYVNHLETVTLNEERSLYVYLLDYGWPDGRWEQVFKRHFLKMADLASDAGAVVIGSPRGVHFANEVLDWHHVGELRGEDVLPGLLITKTHPAYFQGDRLARTDLETLLVVPLKAFCNDEDGFVRSIEHLFEDLRSGAELKNFSVARQSVLNRGQHASRRLAEAIEIKPGAFGFNVDLKKLFYPRAGQE